LTVKVENLTKVYDGQKAIDNISFEIHKGEIVGLLGPNGAGKSTTMKIISCFTLPTSGNVTVFGYDIYDNSQKVREKIGYLPEQNPLYDEMYVKEYLTFIAHVHKLKAGISKRAEEMIEITGLTPERHKLIGALSKGYRQRVGLAAALIHDPEVLILDEPTSGLDPNQIVEIRNLIIETGKEKSIILSSHIMQEVEAICNRVIILNNGLLIADDTTLKLMESSVNKSYYKIEFKNSIDLSEIKKISALVQIKKEGNKYIIETAGIDIREDIFNFAVKSGNVILEMAKEDDNLEKVFQKLTISN
jgi:ABC-2 type transport system ATP-binding protein